MKNITIPAERQENNFRYRDVQDDALGLNILNTTNRYPELACPAKL
ncbi:MAG: hypothetical protein R6V48_01485 [Fidelibacterota bacterium]